MNPNDFCVVIVSAKLPNSITEVLLSLIKQIPDQTRIVILYSGGDSLSAKTKFFNFYLPSKVEFWIASSAMTIGEARLWSIKNICTKYIVYLDDDCIPYEGWWSALIEAVHSTDKPALLFGPRDPDSGSGIGTRVRNTEAKRSRKHLSKIGAPVQIRLDKKQNQYACAGGNMTVLRDATLITPITNNLFIRAAFEDVDFQLRLLKNGQNVIFVPRMRVRHFHPLGTCELLRKSRLSGIGLALCNHYHNHDFKKLSRWGRPTFLLMPTSFKIIGIFVFTLKPNLFIIALVLIILRQLLMNQSNILLSLICWWVKLLRDITILWFYAINSIKLSFCNPLNIPSPEIIQCNKVFFYRNE